MNIKPPADDAERLAAMIQLAEQSPASIPDCINLAYDLGRVQGQLEAMREHSAALDRIAGVPR